MTAPKDDLKAFTARFPAVLYITVQNDVAKRKANGNPKFSMQEWLLEAVREKLYPDLGPEQRNPVEKSVPYFPEKSGSENSAPLMPEYSAGGLRKVSRPTAAELAAKLGIKTGATIEEVEPRMDAESGYIAPVAVPIPAVLKRDWRKFYIDLNETEPMEASVEFRKATEGIKLPVGFLKMPKSRQIAWLTENA